MLQVLLIVLLVFSLVATPMQSIAHAMTVEEGLAELETEIVDGADDDVVHDGDDIPIDDSMENDVGDADYDDAEAPPIDPDQEVDEEDDLDYEEQEDDLDYEEQEDENDEFDETEEDWLYVEFEYFEVTEVTSTTITVEWEPTHDVIGEYNLRVYSYYNDHDEYISLAGDTTTYTFTGLIPGEEYRINLEGYYEYSEGNDSFRTYISEYLFAEAYWTDEELTPVNFIVMLNEDMTYDERIRIRGLSESNQNFERDFWLYESNGEIKLPLGEYEVVLYNEEDYSISAHHNFTINAGVDYKNNPLQFQFKLKEMNEAAEPFKYEIINVKENSFTLRWNDVSKINGFRVYYDNSIEDYWDYVELKFDNKDNEYVFQDLISNRQYWIQLNADYKYDLTKYYDFNVKTDGEDAKEEKVNFAEEALRDAAAKEIGIYDRDVTVVDMEDLNYLNLDRKDITDLEGIQYADNLNYLYLSDNKINDITSLSELINLRYLYLNSNNINNVSALEKMKDLRGLGLSSNQINDISILANLVNLAELNLSYNEIDDISSLKSLTNLNDLSLGGNQIVDVSSLENLTDLEYLYLDNNQISDIASLAKLSNLETLYLSSNEITELPSLSELTSLNSLYLSHNEINDISGLAGLSNLETLYLSSNEITELPSLSELTSLNSLYLSHNEINDISGLAGLSNLETLYLNSNKITELASLSELTSLNSLYLSYNEINNISGLAGLTNLENLTLYNNEITDISALSELKNLRYLDLVHNQITDISVLRELPHLETVYLYGNDITDEETIQYLRNEGVYVGYYGDDWNDWEDDDDDYDDEDEIIIDREEVERVFPAESGFNVSDDGKTITFDISDTDAGDKIDLTPEQTKVLIENKQDLNINRGEVKASIPASSFDNYDEPVTINVNEIESDPNSLSATYDFTIKQGTRNISQFDEGVTLTFNVNASRAKNPNNLKVFYKNEETGKWENIGGTYHNGAVTVVTYHFSTFTVFEAEDEKSDKIVNLDGIENPDLEDGTDDPDSENEPGKGYEVIDGQDTEGDNLVDGSDETTATDDDSGKGYEVIDGQDTEGDNLVDGSDETSATEDDRDSDSDQKETSDGDKALPSTATPIYNYLMIGFMLMLIGFAVLFVSKRRKA